MVAGVQACSRHADLIDEPDGSIASNTPYIVGPPGGVPLVEAGLGSASQSVCSDRPFCEGYFAADLICGVEGWVLGVVAQCQRQIGCTAKNWLSVNMDRDGCVASLGMVDEHAGLVACLVERFGRARCPCSGEQVLHLLDFDSCEDASGIADRDAR